MGFVADQEIPLTHSVYGSHKARSPSHIQVRVQGITGDNMQQQPQPGMYLTPHPASHPGHAGHSPQAAFQSSDKMQQQPQPGMYPTPHPASHPGHAGHMPQPAVQYAPPPAAPSAVNVQQIQLHPVYPQPTAPSTQVVVNQPGSSMGLPLFREWTTSKFGCCSDLTSCCLTMLFPWCYVCYLSSLMGESCCVPLCLTPSPYAVMALRIKLRARNSIQGNILKDCWASTFCFQCTICQMKREYEAILKSKGLKF